MIRSQWQRDPVAARRYFERHLALGDAGSLTRTVPGRWIGTGAVSLGLEPGAEVQGQQFEDLLANRHPISRGRLTVRTNSRRRCTSGMRANRRLYMDCIFAPPKDVSILCGVGGDELRDAVLRSHERGVEAGAREMERYSAVRLRKDGQQGHAVTGTMLACRFTHWTARPIEGQADPLLHDHLILFNATRCARDGEWRALEVIEMLRAQRLARQLYFAIVAAELRAWGLTLESRGDAFGVAGIPAEIVSLYSRRHEQVVAKAETLLKTRAFRDMHAAKRAAAHITRERKRGDHSHEELREHWLARLSPAQRVVIDRLFDSIGSRKAEFSGSQAAENVAELMREAASRCLAIRGATHECALLADAVRIGREAGAYPKIDELRAFLGAGEWVRNGLMIAGRKRVAQEQEMVRWVGERRSRFAPLLPSPSIAGPDFHQADAVRKLLQPILVSCDYVIALRADQQTGRAVTDSLRGLLPVFRLLADPHSEARPTREGVEGVTGSQQRPCTVSDYTRDLSIRSASGGTLLVVEGAERLVTPELLQLLGLARAENCRVLLLAPPLRDENKGTDAIAVLALHAGMSVVVAPRANALSKEQRERRSAIKTVRRGQIASSWPTLARTGREFVLEAPSSALTSASIQEVVNAREPILVLTHDWEAARAMNREVRAQVRLGRPPGTFVLARRRLIVEPARWSVAQRRRIGRYRTGQTLTLQRQIKAGKKGDLFRIQRVLPKSGKLVCQRIGDEHEQVLRPRKQGAAWEVGRMRFLVVAPGDRLLLLADDRRAGICAGSFAVAERVERDGSIALVGGGWIPSNYHAFTHGHAAPVAACSGVRVERLIVLEPERFSGDSLRQAAAMALTQMQVATTDFDAFSGRLGWQVMARDAVPTQGASAANPVPARRYLADEQRLEAVLRLDRRQEAVRAMSAGATIGAIGTAALAPRPAGLPADRGPDPGRKRRHGRLAYARDQDGQIRQQRVRRAIARTSAMRMAKDIVVPPAHVLMTASLVEKTVAPASAPVLSPAALNPLRAHPPDPKTSALSARGPIQPDDHRRAGRRRTPPSEPKLEI